MNRLLQFALTIGRLSQSVSARLDETHIVNLAVAQLVSEGLAGGAILWLLTPEGKLRVAAQKVTHSALAPVEQTAEPGQGRIGRIFAERRLIVTSQMRTAWGASESESLRAAGVHAYAALPLIAEEQPLGIVEIFLADAPTAEESGLLSGFARHLALAIEHARQCRSSESEAGSARLIRALNASLSESSSADAFVQRASQAIGALRLADVVVVNLWAGEDRAGCSAEHRASEQLPSLMAFAEQEQRPPIARYLLTTTSPVIIHSAADSPNFIVQRLHQETHLSSLCCQPVVIDGRVQGSLDLYRFESGAPWQPSEVQLAAEAAQQLSWALRTYHAAESPAAREGAVDFVRQIRHSLDARSILAAAVQTLSDRFEAHRVYGLILPAGADWQHPVPWNRVVSAESLRGARSCLDMPFPIEGHLLLDEVMRSLEPVVVPDVSMTSYFPPAVRTRLEYLQVRSVLLAPIVFNNQMNGVLVVHQDRERQWQQQDVRWIGGLADQLAIAVKYARLFEESAEEALRLRTFVETLRLVMQPPRWRERVQAFVARARRIFSASLVIAAEIADASAETVPILAESFHENSPGPASRRLELPLRDNPLVAEALLSPHAVVHQEIEIESLPPAAKQFYLTLEIRSQVAVTLALKGGAKLLILLCACGPALRDRGWNEKAEQMRLFEELAGLLPLVHEQQSAPPLSGFAPVAAHREARGDERVSALEALKSQTPGPVAAPLVAEDFQEHLERANRNLEELVSTAAHDLQSPLVSIEGYVSRLEQELSRGAADKGPRIAQPVERIRANVAQMQRLIRSLLDVSRLRGDMSLDESVDTRSIAEKLRVELQPKLDSLGAELIVSPDLPVVRGSRVRIGQVFSNLVNNALNYRHPNRAPVVEIGCTVRGGEYEFFVRDNGIGIRPEDFDKIFKPLSRLNPGDTPGTGMGLYIVQRIVEKHGGHIWVDSREGAGSVFSFTLPRHFTH